MAAEARVSRWYFGGLASCGAACCTHPLDLLKTQQEVKLRMTGMALRVVRGDGILALYNGLSASLCRQVPVARWAEGVPGWARVVRLQGVGHACPSKPGPSPQMTYSLTRFAIYETVRDRVAKGSQGPLPFHQKVLLGSISGLAGGFVGTPADLVNVRLVSPYPTCKARDFLVPRQTRVCQGRWHGGVNLEQATRTLVFWAEEGRCPSSSTPFPGSPADQCELPGCPWGSARATQAPRPACPSRHLLLFQDAK
ncbi:hypothetical protein P7K49_012115 [Saguinus oedipus]|uniref:Uncharacterized protein n=1 Tax=Saguinus oedipus TaxID=9490 RepID=A0ABQ9VSL6_SAGOE|nr:hypothetical protein P7K49_012115 [Saguinus oedipus]